MPLKYLQKKVRDEVNFVHANKQKFQHIGNQSFLPGDTIIIDGYDQAFSKYLK